jgi:hypothetical protein
VLKRTLYCTFILIFLTPLPRTLGMVQQSDSNVGIVTLDVFEMWDGPIRFPDVLGSAAIVFAALIGSSIFWWFRSHWIRKSSRVLGSLIICLYVLFVNYLIRCGIGWPSRNPDNGDTTWFFSRSADVCFIVAWISLTVLIVILLNRFTRRLLPNYSLQRTAQKTRRR